MRDKAKQLIEQSLAIAQKQDEAASGFSVKKLKNVAKMQADHNVAVAKLLAQIVLERGEHG